MQVICEQDPESAKATLVRVSGRMDAVGATELWDAASPQVTRDRPSVLVDMSGVDLLSSAGITTLLNLMKTVKPLGGTLCVFGCTPPVRKIFRVVALDGLLNVFDGIEEARQRVR